MATPGTHQPELTPSESTEKPVDVLDATNDHSTAPSELEKGAAAAPPLNPWTDPAAFPEGGRQAWLTVAGSSALLFVSFGWINCVGVFQDYYETHQLKDYTTSQISWIPTLQSKKTCHE